MSDELIWVVTDDKPEDTSGGKGLLDRVPGLRRVQVDPAQIEQEWNRVLGVVGRLLAEAEQQVGGDSGLQLDEVTLAVEINGKGQVSLMGVGGEAAGKGAITLKFKRAAK